MNQQNKPEEIGYLPHEEEYIPSSAEKKRALMMYFLFGIMIAVSNKKLTDFEYFHLKQAMGRWMIFVLSMLFAASVLIVPIIRFLGFLWILFVMVLFVILAKQARDGKHYPDVVKYDLGIFPSLGMWLFSLFSIRFENDERDDEEDTIQLGPIGSSPKKKSPKK